VFAVGSQQAPSPTSNWRTSRRAPVP
jgi:hypothetical protein